MRLLCNKCGRKAIPPQRLRGQGELMCRRHLVIFYMPLIERRSEVALGDKNVLVCLSGRGKTFLNKSLDIHFVVI